MRFITIVTAACALGTHVVSSSLRDSNDSQLSTEEDEAISMDIPNLDFPDLLLQEGSFDDARIGSMKTPAWFIPFKDDFQTFEVFTSTHPISMMSKPASITYLHREDCHERLLGFIPATFSKLTVLKVLTALEYRPCAILETPVEQPDYEITPRFGHDGTNRFLECEYEHKDTNRKFAGRRFSPGKWKTALIGNVLYTKFRNRVKEGDYVSQLKECTDMLTVITRLDSALLKATLDPELYNLDSIMVDEVSPADKKKEDSKEPAMGAGYIILIVLGALAVLGGSYYAYSQYSSKPKIPKKTRRKKASQMEEEDNESMTETFVQ